MPTRVLFHISVTKPFPREGFDQPVEHGRVTRLIVAGHQSLVGFAGTRTGRDEQVLSITSLSTVQKSRKHGAKAQLACWGLDACT